MVSTIDGNEVIEGREFFTRQVLKIHGECQLRSHTGLFMRAVRDQSFSRPTAKDAQRATPRAEHCPCKGWGNPHPGRHHPSCENNAKSPLDEQALALARRAAARLASAGRRASGRGDAPAAAALLSRASAITTPRDHSRHLETGHLVARTTGERPAALTCRTAPADTAAQRRAETVCSNVVGKCNADVRHDSLARGVLGPPTAYAMCATCQVRNSESARSR